MPVSFSLLYCSCVCKMGKYTHGDGGGGSGDKGGGSGDSGGGFSIYISAVGGNSGSSGSITSIHMEHQHPSPHPPYY